MGLRGGSSSARPTGGPNPGSAEGRPGASVPAREGRVSHTTPTSAKKEPNTIHGIAGSLPVVNISSQARGLEELGHGAPPIHRRDNPLLARMIYESSS